jgi:cytoskeletal protein RodZ
MADFGAQLREARERKGISLRQIAASTKISVAALEGLERNDISKLPGGIFSRAFVRSYAIEVGLDPDDTVKQFLQRFVGETTPPAATAPPAVAPPRPVAYAPRPPPAPTGRPVAAASKGALAPADAAGVNDEVDFESKQRMAGVVLKLALVSLPIAVAIIYFGSRSPVPADGVSNPPEASAATLAEAPVAAAAEGAPPEGGAPTPALPASAPAEQRAPAAPLSAAQPLATPVTEADSTAITLEIAPTADCWVQLTTDGTVVVSRVIAAGERESRAFRESALLQVGDAAACAVFLNGRATRPLGLEKQVREIALTRENYRSFLP